MEGTVTIKLVFSPVARLQKLCQCLHSSGTNDDISYILWVALGARM